MADQEELVFEEEDVQTSVVPKAAGKAGHSGAHATGFKDFLLKPEILRAIQECGFEHPSDVQQECIPQAVLGQDVLCQAKPGMGKTAVFVISTLQQLKPVDGECSVLVLCHTRELAFQIHKEYERFAKFFEPAVKSAVFFGGISIDNDRQRLRENHPHIVIGTPGRVAALVREQKLALGAVKHFVLDECDKMIGQPDMRSTVQEIFKRTPHSKQVMMFSATLPADIRPICKKFMHNALEVFVDDDAKLVLKELKQHYVRLEEKEKNRKLFAILDALQFNQVIIFVKSVQRCQALEEVLAANAFPVTSIHGGKRQEERLRCYNAFKTFEKRVLVATDVFGRGMDIERVNIVFNYDLPDEETLVGKTDTYLHRVARAGRFGTKGLAISFLATDADVELLNEVKLRFNIEINELPESLEADSYIQSREK